MKRILLAIAVVAMLAVVVRADEEWPMSYDEVSMGTIPVKLHVVMYARVTFLEDHLNVEQTGESGVFRGCTPILLCNNFQPLDLIARIQETGPVQAETFRVGLLETLEPTDCPQVPCYPDETTLPVTQVHLTGNEEHLLLGAGLEGVDMQSTPYDPEEYKTQVAVIELFVLPTGSPPGP